MELLIVRMGILKLHPIAVIGAFLLLIVLCACGGGSSTPPNNGGGGYTPPQLSITSISPSSMTYGVPLGKVTIHGTGFNPAAAVLLDGVMFQQNTA